MSSDSLAALNARRDWWRRFQQKARQVKAPDTYAIMNATMIIALKIGARNH
jgi:hypothetical protein